MLVARAFTLRSQPSSASNFFATNNLGPIFLFQARLSFVMRRCQLLLQAVLHEGYERLLHHFLTQQERLEVV